ncbi:unnamed protein product [Dicrocoelium dendriticum]|nr:unnamed protein product [Dicrocoelium dendriticum]
MKSAYHAYRSCGGLSEQICCPTKVAQGLLHVGVVYPNPVNSAADWIEALRAHVRGRKFLLMDAFKFPHFDWYVHDCLPGSSLIEQMFLNMVLEAGLVQHMLMLTRLLPGTSPACLDLILTNSEQPVSSHYTGQLETAII